MLYRTILVEKKVFQDVFKKRANTWRGWWKSGHKQGRSAKFRGLLSSCDNVISNQRRAVLLCLCLQREGSFLSLSSVIPNGKGASSKEGIISALVKCTSLLLLVIITFHSHRQKMNWPHLNPENSFVHPKNVTRVGTFPGIWQSALGSNQGKPISRYSGLCQERLGTVTLESQSNASFTVSGPNSYFQSTI